MARKTLVVFDIDGTVAKIPEGPVVGDIFGEDRVSGMAPIPNMVKVVKQYLAERGVEILFCTGRPKVIFGATWRWLNRHLGLARSGKRVALTCRPPEVPMERIAVYKLGAIMQAIRRLGGKPEVLIFDDDIANLRMFETLRPSVSSLRLFKVEDGVFSQWSL